MGLEWEEEPGTDIDIEANKRLNFLLKMLKIF